MDLAAKNSFAIFMPSSFHWKSFINLFYFSHCTFSSLKQHLLHLSNEMDHSMVQLYVTLHVYCWLCCGIVGIPVCCVGISVVSVESSVVLCILVITTWRTRCSLRCNVSSFILHCCFVRIAAQFADKINIT